MMRLTGLLSLYSRQSIERDVVNESICFCEKRPIARQCLCIGKTEGQAAVVHAARSSSKQDMQEHTDNLNLQYKIQANVSDMRLSYAALKNQTDFPSGVRWRRSARLNRHCWKKLTRTIMTSTFTPIPNPKTTHDVERSMGLLLPSAEG